MENIQMNFVSDWKEGIIQEITDAGIQIPEGRSKDSVIIKYFTYLRKRGDMKPRRIHISQQFTCPPGYEAGLEKLINVLKNGEDFSPYLSKLVVKLMNDGMFNDWGILHLHLGEDLEDNNKYVKRTGPLLFLFLHEDDAYLINIYTHQNWTKKEILQLMYDNWPELIDRFKINGVLPNSTFTEQQHQRLRNRGMNVMVGLKDSNGEEFAIVPPGLGITASGDSMNDVRVYHRQLKILRDMEEMIRNNLEMVKTTIKNQNQLLPEVLKFKLVSLEGNWKVVEDNTQLIFEFINEI